MKIKSIKYVGKRKTFDLEVEDNHNFFLSNGVLSHNSQTLKSCCERAFLRGNTKIFDLYAGGAEEGSYYALASNHPFWEDREYNSGGKVTKAMEFPTNVIIPVCKEIPNNLPDIYTPFTIPINSITEEDLKSLLGGDLTKNEIALWRNVVNKINKQTTLIDLLNYMIDSKINSERSSRAPGVSSHGISSVYNMFSVFEQQQIFSSAVNPLALNMKDELQNKEVITSLSLKFFPQQFWGFLINYFIHTIYDLVFLGKIKHNVIIVIREAGDFLEGMTDSPQEEAVKRNIIHALRKSRKHRLFFWIDNQTPLNMDIVKDEFPVKICHYVDNTEELKSALGDLGSMLLNKEDYTSLMSFRPGRCFILTRSGLFAPQVLPPLSRMSGHEGSDFFAIWRSEKGSRFKNIADKLDIIEKEYKDSENKWKEIINERKNKEKNKKERAAIEREEIKMKLEAQKEEAKLIARESKKIDRELEKAKEVPIRKIRRTIDLDF